MGRDSFQVTQCAKNSLGEDMISHQCMYLLAGFKEEGDEGIIQCLRVFDIQDICDLEKSCSNKDKRDTFTEHGHV